MDDRRFQAICREVAIRQPASDVALRRLREAAMHGVIIEKMVDLIPPRSVSNEQVIQAGCCTRARANRILNDIGVASRLYWGTDRIGLVDVALQTAEHTLRDVASSDIGMVYFSTSALNNEQVRVLPSPASQIRDRLGLPLAGAVSSHGGCARMLALIAVAVDYVRLHGRKALVLASESTRPLIHPASAPWYIFGDASVGMLLSPTENCASGFLATSNATVVADDMDRIIQGAVQEALVLELNGNTPFNGSLYMKGGPVGQFVKTTVCRSVERFCRDNEFSSTDVDVLVPHQANLCLMQHLHESLVPNAEMIETIRTRGNNSGASVGVAMCEALATRNSKNKRFLMAAFGSGASVACAYYRATGFETALQIAARASDNPPTSATVGVSNRGTHPSPTTEAQESMPFAILTAEEFEAHTAPTQRILVTSAEEIDAAHLMLPGLCETSPMAHAMWCARSSASLATADEQRRRPGEWPNRLSAGLKHVFRRIPWRSRPPNWNELEAILDAKPTRKIDGALVHKRLTANILLSKHTAIGAITYFGCFNDSPEFRFDHPSDHLQGMLLLEIARQAGIAAVQLRSTAGHLKLVLTSVDVSYQEFVVRDEPFQIRVVCNVDGANPASERTLLQDKTPVWMAFQIGQGERTRVEGFLRAVASEPDAND